MALSTNCMSSRWMMQRIMSRVKSCSFCSATPAWPACAARPTCKVDDVDAAGACRGEDTSAGGGEEAPAFGGAGSRSGEAESIEAPAAVSAAPTLPESTLVFRAGRWCWAPSILSVDGVLCSCTRVCSCSSDVRHVSSLYEIPDRQSKLMDKLNTLRKFDNRRAWRQTYSRGIVVLNISRSAMQTVVHTESEKWAPFDMSKFSKQLMPERANCSLSSRNTSIIIDKHVFTLVSTHNSDYRIEKDMYNTVGCTYVYVYSIYMYSIKN